MKKRVLVVDDDADILEALTVILEESGFEVTSTLHGEEIFKIIPRFKPNVVLLDLLLSGLDARDLTRELKSKNKVLPVIIMSAHPTSGESALESGAEAFISKPFEMDELIEVVNTYS